MTYYDAVVRGRGLLIDAGILPDTATLDADLLARHAAGWDLATWLTRRGEPAPSAFVSNYEQLIARRLTREPVAYIRGVQEFWGREFHVTSAVLIPRPETELLIEQANRFLSDRREAVVVDVGTGSGCIAITLALEHPSAQVWAVDISDEAVTVARANAARLGAERVEFVCGSFLAGVPQPIDLIVTNPPYVAERDKLGLAPEVREFEPDVALYGGADGWRDIRQILRAASTALTPDGRLLMEIGYGQSEHITAQIEDARDLSLVDVVDDLQGIPRLAVIARTTD